VVLPQPDGPSTQTNSPRPTLKLMSLSTGRRPKLLPRCDTLKASLFKIMSSSLDFGWLPSPHELSVYEVEDAIVEGQQDDGGDQRPGEDAVDGVNLV
jgi:hypothetical protein